MSKLRIKCNGHKINYLLIAFPAQQGNAVKLKHHSVLFAPRYLLASEAEEQPRSKKNNGCSSVFCIIGKRFSSFGS
jgi:hypothetical protein